MCLLRIHNEKQNSWVEENEEIIFGHVRKLFHHLLDFQIGTHPTHAIQQHILTTRQTYIISLPSCTLTQIWKTHIDHFPNGLTMVVCISTLPYWSAKFWLCCSNLWLLNPHDCRFKSNILMVASQFWLIAFFCGLNHYVSFQTKLSWFMIVLKFCEIVMSDSSTTFVGDILW